MNTLELRFYEKHAKTRSYVKKVALACLELEAAVHCGPALVSTSWGKDSVVLCHLALGYHLPMVHLKSPYELPGGEDVVKYFQEQGANIITLPTKKTLEEYIEWLQEYGLGYERTEKQKAGSARKAGELSQWARDHGYVVQILGMRAEESRIRKMLFAKRGYTYQRSEGDWISNPIGGWSSKDVWTYIVTNNLPFHPLYDCETHGMTRETLRNCGWLTVKGGWRVPWLREHYPDEYEQLVSNFPKVSLL